MKETSCYRSEFLVVKCPECGYKHYIDIADDPGEGHISDRGRKMTCKQCTRVFLVVP